MSNDDQSDEIEIKIEIESIPAFPLVDSPISKTISGDRGWNLVRRMISNDFNKAQSAQNWKSLTNKSMQKFFGIDSDGETQTNLPVDANKNLVGWNKRQFKVLQNKNFLGGKLKHEAFQNYVENIDEKFLDQEDNYGFYRRTKNVMPIKNDDKLITVLKRQISSPLKVKNKIDNHNYFL